MTDCLNRSLVKNKIVLCNDLSGKVEAHDAGAIGAIFPTAFDNVSFVLPLPASALSIHNYGSVKSYLKTTKYVDI